MQRSHCHKHSLFGYSYWLFYFPRLQRSHFHKYSIFGYSY